MSNATSGHGTVFKLGAGAGPTYTTVAEIKDQPMPAMKRASHDVSNQTTGAGWREFIPGLADGGTLALDMNWIPTDPTQNESTGLLSEFLGGTVFPAQIVVNDSASTTFSFNCFVTSHDADAPVDGPMTLKVELQLTGAVTITNG